MFSNTKDENFNWEFERDLPLGSLYMTLAWEEGKRIIHTLQYDIISKNFPTYKYGRPLYILTRRCCNIKYIIIPLYQCEQWR